MIPSGEALACLPSTLVALCLNTGGLERVQSSHALETFVEVFTSRTYTKYAPLLPTSCQHCMGEACCAGGACARPHEQWAAVFIVQVAGQQRLTCAEPQLKSTGHSVLSHHALGSASCSLQVSLWTPCSMRRALSHDTPAVLGQGLDELMRHTFELFATAAASGLSGFQLCCLLQLPSSILACRALSHDTPAVLGQGLDELMRHVPQLRGEAVAMIVTILHRLHAMGKGRAFPSPAQPEDSTMAEVTFIYVLTVA